MRLALIIRLTIGKAYYENTFRVFHHSLGNILICLAGGGRPLWAAILLSLVATVCYTVFVYRDNITKKEELSCIFFGL